MKHIGIKEIARFQRTILVFYARQGRRFPWRPPSLKLRKGKEDEFAYAILVSEIMLQQTQVDRVVPKYIEWMQKFPTAQALAKASMADVLKRWQGLGYNRRALNLKGATEKIVNECGGKFPRTIPEIDALPGVGPYTAGAVAAFAFDIPSALIETNIRTVYLHFFFKGKREVRDEEILEVIERTMPKTSPTRRRVAPPLLRENYHPRVPSLEGRGGQTHQSCSMREWYNALMDYGAMLKATVGNPNIHSKHYAKQSRFRGSKREVRGMILKKATEQKALSIDEVESRGYPVADICAELVAEGFLRKNRERYRLA